MFNGKWTLLSQHSTKTGFIQQRSKGWECSHQLQAQHDADSCQSWVMHVHVHTYMHLYTCFEDTFVHVHSNTHNGVQQCIDILVPTKATENENNIHWTSQQCFHGPAERPLTKSHGCLLLGLCVDESACQRRIGRGWNVSYMYYITAGVTGKPWNYTHKQNYIPIKLRERERERTLSIVYMYLLCSWWVSGFFSSPPEWGWVTLFAGGRGNGLLIWLGFNLNLVGTDKKLILQKPEHVCVCVCVCVRVCVHKCIYKCIPPLYLQQYPFDTIFRTNPYKESTC